MMDMAMEQNDLFNLTASLRQYGVPEDAVERLEVMLFQTAGSNWWIWFIAGLLVLLLPVVYCFFYALRPSPKEKATTTRSKSETRFRKRDKIEFMWRRVFRKADSLIRGGKGRRRKAVAKLVRRVFHGSSPSGAAAQIVRPDLPDAYLEEEEDTLPPELVFVLNNLRVFGHIDSKIFVGLMKGIEYVTVRQNAYLFKKGDPDTNMYIVESGRLSLSSQPSVLVDGESTANSQQVLKTVGPSEPILSLLSFIGHMGGKSQRFKTVAARATEESRVIKLAFDSFLDALDKHPEQLVKVVQVVMMRLQRVTLLALHQYLGLGQELFHPRSPKRTVMSSGQQQQQEDTGEPLPDTHRIPRVFVEHADVTILDQHELQKLTTEMYVELLDLQDEHLPDVEEAVSMRMSDYVNVTTWDSGDILLEEEVTGDQSLMIVLKGMVCLNQKNVDDDAQEEILRLGPGSFFGQLRTLTDEPSFYNVKALGDDGDGGEVMVATLDAKFVRRCMNLYPKIALKLANSCIEELSPHVRSFDFALEWHQVQSGKALYKQGQAADSTYVVLSGRLRSVISKKAAKKELVGEYARGDLTGIVETLMNTRRSTTVIAVRDSEVAKIPAGLLDAIKVRYPVVLHRLIKMLGQKLQQSWEGGSPAGGVDGIPGQTAGIAQSNFSTVAIIPVSDNVPTNAFAFELLHALLQIDPALLLTKDYVKERLGDDNALHKSKDFKLTEWLASQEDKHRIVLYQCDPEITDWTRLCIRHADVIFILVDPKADATISQLEKHLEDRSRRTRKELVFLHREDTAKIGKVDQWFADRPWINVHHHIRCPRRMYSKRTKYSKIVDGPPPSIHSDFSRLARVVTGQTVGLVLGGGGARGGAHIGMIKAILEAGIPIDYVAGVSIGAFIGGLYALERDITQVIMKSRIFCSKMTQVWRWLLDLTNPHTSYFNGYSFNRVLENSFGANTDIRETWLPFFTITTDITDSVVRVHDYGSMWRYVRGSMSLAGWLPPICDPHDGHLLLDGGYSNNLPADVMRNRGAKHILAVDVGSEDNSQFSNYGDTLSGFQIFFSKFNPFGKSIVVPNQAEIQLRLAYVSCIDKLESVKNSGFCEYIRPPIEKYGTLQFQSFDEIREVGYRHGETYFKGFKKAGLMRQFYWSEPGQKRRHSVFSINSAMRRGSVDNIGSFGSSADSGCSPVESTTAKSNFADLAKMMESLNNSAASCSIPRRRSSRGLMRRKSSSVRQNRDSNRDETDSSSSSSSSPSPSSSDDDSDEKQDVAVGGFEELSGLPSSSAQIGPGDATADFSTSGTPELVREEDIEEDIDSENLISDEENDNASTILSPM